MVNALRTLLLNLPAAGALPGEEYIDPSFTPVALPAPLITARAALFGPQASRHDVNQNLARLLLYMHGSILAADVTLYDPRITYDPALPTNVIGATGPITAYSFVSAAEVGDPTAVFRAARSIYDAGWWSVWGKTSRRPLKAAAFALALAARINDLASGRGYS